MNWYQRSHTLVTRLLLPWSWLFSGVVSVRRRLYQSGIKKTIRLPVPVIIVGNITIGGTGKTPFVMWLVDFLQQQGFKPGIVSRGYGGQRHVTPQWVTADSDPALVGDETVLLAHRCACPVVVCVDRVAAGQALLAGSECNIVVADDGLQHYRLGRDIEIALLDDRRLGNRALLPAGPLREAPARLNEVDFVVVQGTPEPGEFAMVLQGDELISLSESVRIKRLADFKNQQVHALAGIGNPRRFFNALAAAGLNIIEHTFPDHHYFQVSDIQFNDRLPVIMTEKDAVKCVDFADDRHWFLRVTAQIDKEFAEVFLKKLRSLPHNLQLAEGSHMLRKCIFLLSLIFSLAVHAETDAKKPPVYTDTAKGILATRDASEFTIQIPTNFTTGYSWFLSKYDASLITPLRYEYKPPENRDLVGAPGVTLWTFRVLPAAFLVPRQTQIEFVSVRPWDTIEAGKTLTFTVNASAAGF